NFVEYQRDDTAMRRTVHPEKEVTDPRGAEKVLVVELYRFDLWHHRVHARVLAPAAPEAALDLGHPAILGFFSKPGQGVAKDAHLPLVEIGRGERVEKALQFADHLGVGRALVVKTGGQPPQNRVGSAHRL